MGSGSDVRQWDYLLSLLGVVKNKKKCDNGLD